MVSRYPTFSASVPSPPLPLRLKPQSVQVNGCLSACSAPSRPVEADSPGPAHRKQYNSPIGLYSEDTLREMAAIQAGYVETRRRKHGRRFLRGRAEKNKTWSDAAKEPTISRIAIQHVNACSGQLSSRFCTTESLLKSPPWWPYCSIALHVNR